MLFKMMSIFDAAVGTYSPPFCVRAVGQAIRDFTKEAKTEGSRICQAPNDYSLFELGEFDDEHGSFIPLVAPRRIVSGHEVDVTS